MYIFLPRDKDGLGKLIGATKPDDFAALFSEFAGKKGTVVLPRFKIEFEQSLNAALKQLGMKQAFGLGDDFTRMVMPPYTSMGISDVLHKTFVEVNEEGIEAAAVTGVKMTRIPMPRPEDKFSLVCDHPFLCAIRDDVTGSVFFLCAIFDPKHSDRRSAVRGRREPGRVCHRSPFPTPTSSSKTAPRKSASNSTRR